MGLFSPNRKESKYSTKNEEEFECNECGSTYTTKTEADECCTNENETEEEEDNTSEEIKLSDSAFLFSKDKKHCVFTMGDSDTDNTDSKYIIWLIDNGYEPTLSFNDSGNSNAGIIFKKKELK